MAREQIGVGTLETLQAHIRMCRRCLNAGHRPAGRPIAGGSANARLLIVGQAPSASDDQNRRLWSGPAGRRLLAWLEWAGLPEETLRSRHYLTAITRCYPGRAPDGHGDRLPSRAEMELCQPFLQAELALLDPRLVIPVGRLAIDAFGGQGRALSELIGQAWQVDDTWIVPLPHPSGASLWLNEAEHRAHLARALAIVRELCRGLGIA